MQKQSQELQVSICWNVVGLGCTADAQLPPGQLTANFALLTSRTSSSNVSHQDWSIAAPKLRSIATGTVRSCGVKIWFEETSSIKKHPKQGSSKHPTVMHQAHRPRRNELNPGKSSEVTSNIFWAQCTAQHGRCLHLSNMQGHNLAMSRAFTNHLCCLHITSALSVP